MKIRAYIRKLLGFHVDCPWCGDRLDTHIRSMVGKSFVAIVMDHAPLCNNYRGHLKKATTKVWVERCGYEWYPAPPLAEDVIELKREALKNISLGSVSSRGRHSQRNFIAA